MKSLSLVILLLGLLEPTTRHEQLRDDWGLAWLLLEQGRPMILRVPDTGVLRLRVRSAGGGRVKVRAAGDLVTQRRLIPGVDPGAGFPGDQPGPMIELRVTVPGGGESYRVEMDRGKAWLAPSYLDMQGQSHRYELADAAPPALVDLGAPQQPELQLIPPEPETDTAPPPELALVPPETTETENRQPDLALVPPEKGPALVIPGKEESAPPLVSLGDEEKKKDSIEGFTLELSDEDSRLRERRLARVKPPAKAEPKAPKGPGVMTRFRRTVAGMFGRSLKYSLGGDADFSTDRLGARATAELLLPMMSERFSALAYAGYRPSSLRGVAVTGQGVAMPLLVEGQQNDLPLGLALRWRSKHLTLANAPFRVHVQGSLNWVQRQEGLSVELLRASRREALRSESQTRAGLGLGVSTEMGPVILESTAQVDLGPTTPVALVGLAQAAYPAAAARLSLGARWRFGEAKLPEHLQKIATAR